MADKIFIGKSTKDKWGNPKISLNAEDVEKPKGNLVGDRVTIVFKESQKKPGSFYAEVDTWIPQQQNGQQPNP